MSMTYPDGRTVSSFDLAMVREYASKPTAEAIDAVAAADGAFTVARDAFRAVPQWMKNKRATDSRGLVGAPIVGTTVEPLPELDDATAALHNARVVLLDAMTKAEQAARSDVDMWDRAQAAEEAARYSARSMVTMAARETDLADSLGGQRGIFDPSINARVVAQVKAGQGDKDRVVPPNALVLGLDRAARTLGFASIGEYLQHRIAEGDDEV